MLLPLPHGRRRVTPGVTTVRATHQTPQFRHLVGAGTKSTMNDEAYRERPSTLIDVKDEVATLTVLPVSMWEERYGITPEMQADSRSMVGEPLRLGGGVGRGTRSRGCAGHRHHGRQGRLLRSERCVRRRLGADAYAERYAVAVRPGMVVPPVQRHYPAPRDCSCLREAHHREGQRRCNRRRAR